MAWFWGDDDRDQKRTFGVRDKKILWERAHHKCQNCGKRIGFDVMEVGHKNPWSKGGSTTYRNAVVLCHKCNNLQGTDSWATFQRKQGKAPAKKAQKKKRRKKDSIWDFSLKW